MLVLSFQKAFVLERVFNGGYRAKMGRSEFCRMSERFYRGYRRVKEELVKVADMEVWESPIWAWVGEPVMGGLQGEVAVFVDVSVGEMVFSDYERYCDYVKGESLGLKSGFMLSYGEAMKEVRRGRHVQACFAGLDMGRVVAVTGIGEVKDCIRNGAETVSDLYRSAKMWA